MRILQVTDSYAPAVGGMERYVEALSGRLAERGETVAVCTMRTATATATDTGIRSGGGTGNRTGSESAGDRGRAGVEVFRVASLAGRLRPAPAGEVSFLPPFTDPVFAERLSRVIGAWRPDVVHAHGWSVHSCLPVVRRHGVRLVVGLHDYGLVCPKKTLVRIDGTTCTAGMAASRCVPCSGEQYGGRPAAAAVYGPLALARPRRWPASRFVANSRYLADTVTRLGGVDGARITVVPPSTLREAEIMAPGTSPGPAPLVDAPAGLPDGPFLLFVGALGRHKGLDVLLRARRLMRVPWPLVVLGPRGRPADRPGADLDDDVHVRHDVPHRQVMQLWRRAAVGVVPSVWPEPFGQVAVECLATGTPVVVSDVGGLTDLVEHGRTGLVVPPGDPAALAAALDLLAADEPLRARLGAAGRAACRELTVEATTDRILALYHQLRDTPATPAGSRS